MAGETVKTSGICLAVHPWSQTSHVVIWLTPGGKVKTVVKGAVRAKSAFLGQYDLNYTCEILYYARAKSELHALRECSPVKLRENMRGDYRCIAASDYCRHLAGELAPAGNDSAAWFSALENTLDAIGGKPAPARLISRIIAFELEVLALSGLAPDFTGFDEQAEWSAFSVEEGRFCTDGRRFLRIPPQVAQCLNAPQGEYPMQILLDAARVIGVFYQFHLDCASDVRRTVLRMISTTTHGSGET